MRTLSLITAVVLVTVSLFPLASAASTADPEVTCGYTAVWCATFCWVGVAAAAARALLHYATCDIVGGPACDIDLCDHAELCPE